MMELNSRAEVIEEEVYNSNFEWLPPILQGLDYAALKEKYNLEGVVLFLVCGVSTAGKDTLLRSALEQEKRVKVVPRATSRPPRPGERDGVDYFFNLNKVILWSSYGGNYYAITEEVIQRLKDLKCGVMIQGLVYFKLLRYLVEKLGGKLEVIYILPAKINSGIDKMIRVIMERLPLRHKHVMRQRLTSINLELNYVLSHVDTLKNEGVFFIENTPSNKGYSIQALKILTENIKP